MAHASLSATPSGEDSRGLRPSEVREATRVENPTDLPAFEVVYDRYVDFVYRSVRRLGVTEAAAEDITQEVFITVHRKLDTFEGRSSLKTWIFGVAHGVVRNHRRSAKRARDRDGGSTEDMEIADPITGNDPLRQAERSEAVQILHAVLAAMDEDKREVFLLADLEKIPPAEIASFKGMKLFTVYSRLRAARAQFKKLASRYRTTHGWRMS